MKISLVFLILAASILYSNPRPQIPFQPEHYLCHQTDTALKIDGTLNEPSWQQAIWTNEFVDIQGDLQPKPTFPTRVKMLWDKDFLYIAAELVEPHIWAKLSQRDTIIFYDNDFEIFIDPDGDTYNYYELEINALNTVWDLYLDKPYRDHGTALFHWDIAGLQTAVDINGTLNDPSDIDSSWTVEIAIPWDVLEKAAHKPTPPKDGDYWRINFSRVEWHTEIIDGNYVKKINPETGKHFPEENWVWSPQGLINMHYPEMWGFLHFTTKNAEQAKPQTFDIPEPEKVKWELWKIYYAEKEYFAQHEKYTPRLKALKTNDLSKDIKIETTSEMFHARLVDPATRITWNINHDGHIWNNEK